MYNPLLLSMLDHLQLAYRYVAQEPVSYVARVAVLAHIRRQKYLKKSTVDKHVKKLSDTTESQPVDKPNSRPIGCQRKVR